MMFNRQGRVSLHLAAQHGGSAPEVRDGLLVWWWFENSRAYLLDELKEKTKKQLQEQKEDARTCGF